MKPTPQPDTFLAEWLSRLPATLEEASEFERGILADGEVTADEHKRAQLAYRECVESGGVRVLAFSTYDNGLLREASFSMEEPGAEDVVSTCEADFYRYVPEGFGVALTPNDSSAKFAERTAACLIDAGFDVDPSPTDIGVLALDAQDDPYLGAALGPCVEEVKFSAP